MSDPRYPSAFQRPGSTPPQGAEPSHAVPSAEPSSSVRPAASGPEPGRRPRASARRIEAEDAERSGNRIVLLGGGVEDELVEAPASQRNLAIGGLYALATALLALALLGGLWSQGLMRGLSEYSTTLNPDGLQELYFGGAESGTVGFARLLVQLAPTTLALGVLALLVAIALPVLTRRPR